MLFYILWLVLWLMTFVQVYYNKKLPIMYIEKLAIGRINYAF